MKKDINLTTYSTSEILEHILLTKNFCLPLSQIIENSELKLKNGTKIAFKKNQKDVITVTPEIAKIYQTAIEFLNSESFTEEAFFNFLDESVKALKGKTEANDSTSAETAILHSVIFSMCESQKNSLARVKPNTSKVSDNPNDNFALWRKYLIGDNLTPRDEKLAFAYLTLAADQGNPEAQFLRGLSFEQGFLDSAPNQEQAIVWLEKAANNNHPKAMTKLGLHYWNGQTCVQYKKGIELLIRANELGCPEAAHRLFLIYSMHSGLDQELRIKSGITIAIRETLEKKRPERGTWKRR